MIRNELKTRQRRLRRKSADCAPLIAREIKKAASRKRPPKEELRFLQVFMEVVNKRPPPPEINIDEDLREIKRCIEELKESM
jgi:hypothetical protein